MRGLANTGADMMRQWLALAAMIVALAGGIYAWTRTPSHGNAAFAAAPVEAGRPIPAGEAPLIAAAPLVAPVSDITPEQREARRFNRYDKDKNGDITKDEYFTARRKAFAKLDTDGDGRLSFDEYSAKALKKFTTADADRDGKLLPVEFATTAVKRKPRAANCPPPEAAPAEADKEG